MQTTKTYFILINSGMAYDRKYEIKGEQRTYRLLGAVISRHRTLASAMRNRELVEKYARNPIKTDIVKLHFWIGLDDYVGEQYGGANNFSYRPVSALQS